MFVVARGCAAWCVSVESPKNRNVDLSSLCQGCFTQHHLVLSHGACSGCFMDLYSSCVLAFEKHVFVSWRAPHSTSPYKNTTLSKFHSHLSALVLRACGSATWSVRTSRIKSLHVHICRDIFPPIFRIVTVLHYSLGYRAACCWQGVHFFMFVSVEPASSMHTHKSDSQLRAHHRKSCEICDE